MLLSLLARQVDKHSMMALKPPVLVFNVAQQARDRPLQTSGRALAFETQAVSGSNNGGGRLEYHLLDS